jgi:hypothetical protein
MLDLREAQLRLVNICNTVDRPTYKILGDFTECNFTNYF